LNLRKCWYLWSNCPLNKWKLFFLESKLFWVRKRKRTRISKLSFLTEFWKMIKLWKINNLEIKLKFF
jgi:hypothetical protein